MQPTTPTTRPTQRTPRRSVLRQRPVPPGRVFAGADLAAIGWTPDAVRHAVDTGALTRLHRGVYTATPEPGPIEHALAAQLARPGAVISHRSAAAVLGLPLLDPAPGRPQLTVPPRGALGTADCEVHRAHLARRDVVTAHGGSVTGTARTFVDVARGVQLPEAVVVGDAALRAGATTDAVDELLVRCWNWPGIRRAQRAATLIDGAAESALESLSRLVVSDADLPRPSLQQSIHNSWHGFVARCDFYWDEFGVVGEADGNQKYVEHADLVQEKRRQERLEQLGLIVVRWGWRDVVHAPHELIARLTAAFARGRDRLRSGFHPEWVLGVCVSPAAR